MKIKMHRVVGTCSFFYSDIVISMSSRLSSTTTISGIVIHIGARRWPGLGLWTHVRVGIGHWSVVGINFIWTRWSVGPSRTEKNICGLKHYIPAEYRMSLIRTDLLLTHY